jgi:competence protein ComGC
MSEIRRFKDKKVVGLNQKGRLFVGLLLIIFIISIMYILNVKAVDTRGNHTMGLRDRVIELCAIK